MSTNATLQSEVPVSSLQPALYVQEQGLAGRALARFLQLRGRRIVESGGLLWYTVPGRFLMSLPYQAMLDPDPRELNDMVREAGVFGARFPSQIWSGLPSGLYVFRPRNYEIHTLHIKHRPRVRHGLNCFEIRPAKKHELLEQGMALNLGTMARQGRYDPEFGERRQWERFVEAAFDCPEISFPAAFSGARLAAYMVTCREQRWLHILHQMSRHEDLPDFPNHVLTYSVTKRASEDPDLEAVCYGCIALVASDGLHEYKQRFGYEVIPHRSVIHLNPNLDRWLNHSAVRATLSCARRFFPNNQRLETAQTVLEGAHLSRCEGKR